MNNFRNNLRYWIAGVSAAAVGVTLARMVAPSLGGHFRLWLTVGGQFLALGGLLIICLGIRRRILFMPLEPAPK